MAKIEIRVHSDFDEDIKPLEAAFKGAADAVEGYYAYITGCTDLNERNYVAMLWASNHLSGLISQLRPVYEFGYSEEQDAELSDLMAGPPYPPYTPYKK
ncbi:hypothetical protein N8067_03065 [Planktomarina temperata]|jgi:hypothetical protein|nr:hypothetical protein [Planktomarina temperata]MDC1259006.1 hypothetical protein [Planktomarina temperata]